MTKTVNTAAKSNASSIGANVVMLVRKGDEVKTGPVFLAHAHGAELTELAAKALAADVVKNNETRQTLLDFFYASPEGGIARDRFNALKAMDHKTKEQDAEQATLHRQNNAAVTLLDRACRTAQGVNVLRAIGCQVLIERLNGQQSYVCYVNRNIEGDRDNMRITAQQLQTLSGIKSVIELEKLGMAGILTAASSAKKGAANEDKGNAEAIAPRQLPDVMAKLDTSLAGVEAIGGKTKEQAHLLWARLDSLMSAEEKAKAREAFYKLGVEEERKDVVAKVKLEKAVNKHRKSA